MAMYLSLFYILVADQFLHYFYSNLYASTSNRNSYEFYYIVYNEEKLKSNRQYQTFQK